MITFANIRNGLAYPHDDVCMFQSCHGHHASDGYFRIDAMPYRAVIELLSGRHVRIVDATSHDKPLSDALLRGVPTWALVFNRALGMRDVRVCDWATPEMVRVAHGDHHRPLVNSIRKIARVVGSAGPVVIGQNLHLVCHRSVEFDDKPEMIASAYGAVLA